MSHSSKNKIFGLTCKLAFLDWLRMQAPPIICILKSHRPAISLAIIILSYLQVICPILQRSRVLWKIALLQRNCKKNLVIRVNCKVALIYNSHVIFIQNKSITLLPIILSLTFLFWDGMIGHKASTERDILFVFSTALMYNLEKMKTLNNFTVSILRWFYREIRERVFSRVYLSRHAIFLTLWVLIPITTFCGYSLGRAQH